MQTDIPNETDSRVRTLFENIAEEIVGSKKGKNMARYHAAMVVLAATYAPLGANSSAIAKWTGIDGRTVAAIGRRLEASELWKDAEVHYDPAEEHELTLAVLVAEGTVVSSAPEEKSEL